MAPDFRNRIFGGDCIEIMPELPEHCVSACLTDPPYNYEFIGHKWDSREIQRRVDRVQSSDNNTLVKNIPYGSGLAGGVRNERWYKKNRDNIIEYQEWCYEWGRELFRICKPGATVAVFNSTRTVAHVQVALERAGFYARDIVVYRRSTGIPKGVNIAKKLASLGFKKADEWEGWHSCLRSEWEAICVLQKPLVNNYARTFLEYGTGLFYTKTKDGGFQSNIFENIPRDKKRDKKVHCTTKPLALMERLVETFVPRTEGSLVIDPFAGSGTTLVAASRLGVDYTGIEIVPEYVDVIHERLNATEKQEMLPLAR